MYVCISIYVSAPLYQWSVGLPYNFISAHHFSLFIRINLFIYVCVYFCVPGCVYVYISLLVYMSVYVFAYQSVYLYVCVCQCVYMYVFRNMPDIDKLMEEWPPEVEELLKEVYLIPPPPSNSGTAPQ